MKEIYRNMIKEEFLNCVNNTISRMGGEPTFRPFHTALLSEEAIVWSRFERSFSTSFGQRVIEEIARIVALANGATEACRQKITQINIDEARFNAIQRHIEELRSGDIRNRDWNDAIREIKTQPLSGKTYSYRLISDLYWEKDGIENYMSIKTVKPNIDQTAIAKQDCLALTLSNPKCNAYFGLPYNPYGESKELYKHNPPMGIFNFHNDSVVLIGKDMWDTIGGEGCYDEILDLAKEVGKITKTKISELIK